MTPVRPLSSCGAFGFSRSIPIGRLGNSLHKVRQSRVNANEHSAVGLDFFGAAFRILPAKWVFPEKSRPIPWLMPLHQAASFPCKELPIPERAVDKKNSTRRETGNKKNALPLTGGRFISSFTLNRCRRDTNRRKQYEYSYS